MRAKKKKTNVNSSNFKVREPSSPFKAAVGFLKRGSPPRDREDVAIAGHGTKKKQEKEAAAKGSAFIRRGAPSGSSLKEQVNFIIPDGIEMPLFKDSLLLRVAALNKERLISALSRGGVELKQLTIKDGAMYFVVAKKDAPQTFAICEKLCYNISVCGESGISRIMINALKRIGLVAGTVVFAALIAFSTTFIWKIEIAGNNNVDSVLIERLLRDNNIRVGGSKSIDLKQLTTLINDLEGIEDSTAAFDGTTLRINVVESTVFQPPQETDSSAVIAGFDAVIARIIAHKGTAAVKVGQAVKKGDVLIKGERTTQAGDVIPDNAAGEVYGRVSYGDHYTVSTLTERPVYGKPKRKTRLSLFGLKIGKLDVPAGCEAVTSESKLSFLPIKVTTVSYRRVETVSEEIPLAELTEQCIKKTVLKFGVLTAETTYNVERLSDNIYRVNVYVSGEREISFKEN